MRRMAGEGVPHRRSNPAPTSPAASPAVPPQPEDRGALPHPAHSVRRPLRPSGRGEDAECLAVGPAQTLHASCVARDGAGVLLLGRPGAGKSDLALRLLARGFDLVADDRVMVADGRAAPPPALAGLLEVRGLGIVRRPYVAPVRLALVVRLGANAARLPDALAPGLPAIALDPAAASAPERVALALDCALGRAAQLVGAFAA